MVFVVKNYPSVHQMQAGAYQQPIYAAPQPQYVAPQPVPQAPTMSEQQRQELDRLIEQYRQGHITADQYQILRDSLFRR